MDSSDKRQRRQNRRLLPKTNYTLTYIEQEADNDILSLIHDLADVSATVSVAFFDTEAGKFLQDTHVITVMGLVINEKATDFTDRYKGIIVTDSDDDMPWDDLLYGPSYLSDEERAKRAAEAPNYIDFYPLSWEMTDGIGCWIIEDIYSYDYIKGVIYAITTLSDFRNDDPGEEKGEEDHHDNNDNNDKSENETFIIVLPDYDPGIDYDALKAAMIMDNLLIFSPQASKYNTAEGSEYSLYVRRLRTMMANVYVDGNRVPQNGISYRTVMLPNGMYKIIFSSDYMQSLGKGNHTVRLEFCNADDIETVIEVE